MGVGVGVGSGGRSLCRAATSIELYCTWDGCWEPNKDGSMDQSLDVLHDNLRVITQWRKCLMILLHMLGYCGTDL